MPVDNRFIPILQIANRRLVKTVKFVARRYLGDPLNAVKVFNLKEASELIIMDINATQTKNIDFAYLTKIAGQAFIPLTYGGGISSIDDVDKIFQLGFDKLLFGSTSITDPELIIKTAEKYGNQSIICAVNFKQGLFGEKITFCGNRKNAYGFDLEKAILNAIRLGAGEILLHDIERDGTGCGLRHELFQSVIKKYDIPIMLCGGARDKVDMQRAISYGASAVAAGSVFSFYGKHNAVLINYGN